MIRKTIICVLLLMMLTNVTLLAQAEEVSPLSEPEETESADGFIDFDNIQPPSEPPQSLVDAATALGVQDPIKTAEAGGGVKRFLDKVLSFFQTIFEFFNSLVESFPGGLPGLLMTAAVASTMSACPIVLDLNRNGKADLYDTDWRTDKHFRPQNAVIFDIDADGQLELCEWMKPNCDGLLVINDGDDWVRNQAELLGNGGGYNHGYEKLAALVDADGDGVIKGEELKKLRVWIDDGDAVSEDGELHELADLGITHISVTQNDLQSTFIMNGEEYGTWDWWTEYID